MSNNITADNHALSRRKINLLRSACIDRDAVRFDAVIRTIDCETLSLRDAAVVTALSLFILTLAPGSKS